MTERVPVNLITGFLGVGKTTAIRHLLANKPADEYWAVLVNEFGEVGIDGAAIAAASDQLDVVEVPGGCICCTTSPMLRVSLTKLLQKRRPTRLIIEPSGLGHPSGIVDMLRDPWLAKELEVRATITLLDPRHLNDSRYTTHDIWREQIALGDVLIANKCDRADAEDIDRFEAMGAAIFPPKLAVLTTTQARIDPALLDLQRETVSSQRRYRPRAAAPTPATGAGMGWIWPAEIRFSADALATFFRNPTLLAEVQAAGLLRAKGVFHTDQGWLLFNWVDGEANAVEIAWRQDSRCEVLVGREDAGLWAAVQAALEVCVLP